MNTTRIGDITKVGAQDLHPGMVYVLKGGGFTEYDVARRESRPVETLHVISKTQGGEVRGYKRFKGDAGPWRLRHPSYPPEWPEMDAAVAALLGESVSL